MKEGNISAAPASVISDSESGPDNLNKIKNTSEFFRKLSLNALKNWHQKSGAKRLLAIKVVNTILVGERSSLSVATLGHDGVGERQSTAH